MSTNNDTVLTENNYQEEAVSDVSASQIPIKVNAQANKKLSESKLRLAAIAAPPTNTEAEISLKESLKGASRTFLVKDQVVCSDCANTKPINRLHCVSCRGLGYTHSERLVEIKLQPGLSTAEEVRYAGLGAYDIRSSKNGDLIVRIKVSEHHFFKVDGKNVTCTLPVSLYDATLGSNIEVPTVTGKVMMVLKPLTQPGAVYRLRGLGIGGGDQLLTIEVSMPRMLNKEQVALFQRLKQIADMSATQTNLLPSIN